jgi:tetratricopeptide (TPR) repeat protein
VASTYGNIGLVYEKQGLYEKALEYYQKDLEITVRVVGHDHLDVAKTYNNVGGVYRLQCKYDETLVE